LATSTQWETKFSAGEALLALVSGFTEPIGAQKQLLIETIEETSHPCRSSPVLRPGIPIRRSQQSCLREAQITPPSHNMWSCHRYVEDAACLNQLFRHNSIVTGRRGIAARVIVNENYCGCILRNRLAKYFARDGRATNSKARELL
jgi:hypothetical protein